VLLRDAVELGARPARLDREQRGPEPPVHQRDLAAREAARGHLAAVVDRVQQGEDALARRVAPPAAADGLAGDGLGQVRQRAAPSLQHRAVGAHEVDSVGGGLDHSGTVQRYDAGMRRLVIFLLGLCVLLFVAKKYLDGPGGSQPNQPSQAKRRLDDMRDKAKEIERQQDQRAEEVLKGSESK
jgi:hypothetical protein